ncbi:MAG: acetyl/propionyl/methylcrotonyl-CoA carboxylase subunit alpha [Pseudomonadota bacterium]
MISKILVANRGEIACRIIKTAKSMGIKTVAVYSSVDCNALHVSMANEAVHLGPAPSPDSYLRGDLIVAHAKSLNVDAIHPGYGFLSENAEFATLCEHNNIIFIGPPADAITSMGDKSIAKRLMHEAGVPLVPGYHGDNQTPAYLREQANAIGYPVLIKASAGGGGKGMRAVQNEDEFDEALDAAKRESMKSFGDDHVLIEKMLTQPRHIEMQVYCDNHGNAVHLFERDCSIQRRHQKIIEEAPAPNFSQEIREQMGETAKKAALAIGYRGAGTVEFLYQSNGDPSDGDPTDANGDGRFYFMEMNTRLQVEHPVTEYITGIDMVEWQIDIANAKPLPKTQEEIMFCGHAIEARIYAEDPDNDFLPSTGTLDFMQLPGVRGRDVRVDTGIQQGDEISVYYDPMIAKLITYGEERDQARVKLENALREYRLGPIKTNINYLLKVVRSRAFCAAELTTNFVSQQSATLSKPNNLSDNDYITAFVLASVSQHSISPDANDSSAFYRFKHFRLNHTFSTEITLAINHVNTVSRVVFTGANQRRIHLNGSDYSVSFSLDCNSLSLTIDDKTCRYTAFKNEDVICIFGEDGQINFDMILPDIGVHQSVDVGDDIIAPMNGVVVDVLVSENETVKKGQTLIIIEAMKMEQSITAPRDGIVARCTLKSGDRIDGGAPMMSLEN